MQYNKPTGNISGKLRRLFSRQGNPWYPGQLGRGTMGRLRRMGRRCERYGALGEWSWIGKALLTFLWPLRSAAQAWPLWRRYAPAVRRRSGLSHSGQWWQLWSLSLYYGLPPRAYYQHRLFQANCRRKVGQFLFNHEISAIFACLNRFAAHRAVDDKRVFAQLLAKSGIPTAPTLAWYDGENWYFRDRGAPSRDLFTKPARGCRGQDVGVWLHCGHGDFVNPGNSKKKWPQVLDIIRKKSNGRSWLIQPVLRNHPALGDLTPGPLVCARIMTARTEHHGIKVFSSIIKMPTGRQQTNNYGIASAIAMDTGLLGPAYAYRPLHPGIDRHPDTGAIIRNRQVPFWEEAKRLTRKAHAVLDCYALLGWDVAFTPSGPRLLEVNANWDAAMPQIATQTPFGESQFTSICENILSELK